MINYELAKKLKDAGFPLKCTNFTEEIMYPLLSELIEACGPIANLFTLSFLEGNRGSGLDKDGNCINDEWIAEQGDFIGLAGSTPEEAVANLWLSINKKQNNVESI